MDEWYCSDGVDQFGPWTADEIRTLAASGQLKPSYFLWAEGLDDWILASRVDDLVFQHQIVAQGYPSTIRDLPTLPTDQAVDLDLCECSTCGATIRQRLVRCSECYAFTRPDSAIIYREMVEKRRSL